MSSKTFLLVSSLVLMALLLCLSILFSGLPFFTQALVMKRYGPQLKEWHLGFKIQDMDLSGALLTDLQFGPDLTADSAVVSYHLKGISLPDPRQIVVSGLTATAALDESRGLQIRGIPIPAGGDTGRHTALADYLELVPEQITLKNSVVMLLVKNRFIRIPFDVSLSLNRSDQAITCRARLYPFSQPIEVVVGVNAKGGVESAKITTRGFNLSHLAPFLPPDLAPALSGTVDMVLEKMSRNRWEVHLSELAPLGNAGPVFHRINTGILLEKGRATLVGECEISHSSFPAVPFLSRLELRRTGDENKEIQFHFNCENQTVDELPVELAGTTAKLGRPMLAGTLSGTPEHFSGRFTLNCSNALVTHSEERLGIKQLDLACDIRRLPDGGEHAVKTDVAADMAGILIQNRQMTARFKQAQTRGRISFDRAGFPTIDLTAHLDRGDLDAPAYKLAARGIDIQVPVTYPHVKGAGKFSTREIAYDNRFHLTTHGRLQRTGFKEIGFDGSLRMKDTDDIGAAFIGTAGFDDTFHARFELGSDQFRLSSGYFEDLAPELWAADYEFDLSAVGTVELKDHQLKTGGELTIHNGTMSLPDMNMNLSGIRGKLALNNLLVPESLPGQTLTIDTITADRFKFDNAVFRYSLEDGRYFLLENARLNWCNGLVSTESVRFPSADNSLSLALYCDRLELTQLLDQMGAFRAEGEGTLNGRLPVRYADGNISFDNGFLFSTPGQGGKVVIENTDKLLAGIPMDSPQFVQLDLAKEALRDFQYEWAKLTLNSRQDTLDVKMELDGKPVRPLPFVYHKDLGSFMRVDAKSPGSRFQGIKLDVNLKLPFNQVLKFGNKIKNMME